MNNQVNYFGVEVEVPEQFNYLAMDANGQLWAFENEPVLDISSEEGFDTGWCMIGDFMPIYTDTYDQPCPFADKSLITIIRP